MSTVIVINSPHSYRSNNELYPPVGTIGTVISTIDKFGEYDVLFNNYPCTATPDDPSWITHKSMIVFIDTCDKKIKKEKSKELLIS